MNKKQNQLATPTEQRQEQERQTNEALLAEDAVQTTAYLANAGLLLRRRAAGSCARNARLRCHG